MAGLSQGVYKAAYDFAPWPALPPCGCLCYDTHSGRRQECFGACAWITLLPAVPFFPSFFYSMSPLPRVRLALDKEKMLGKWTCSLKVITTHGWVSRMCICRPLVASNLFQRLSVQRNWREGSCGPSGFLKYLHCVPDTPQRVASDSFPWVFAAISCTQKDLDTAFHKALTWPR